MFSKKHKNILWVCVTCLLLLTSSPAPAEIPNSNLQNHTQFQIINQSSSVKIVVTIAGISLIGLELWWFLYRR